MSDVKGHHILVVAAEGDDIWVRHPDCLPVEVHPGKDYSFIGYPDCPVDWEIGQIGFDSLKHGDFADNWPPPDGEYAIEFWSEKIVIPMVGTEYDTGLRLVEENADE